MIQYIVDGMMMPILTWLHSFTGSYGLAIVCLTLIIRGGMFPLTAAQFKNMRRMQVVMPRLKAIQAEFKDQPEVLNQKVMAFYQEHQLNPVGGCLPLVIQMPFLLALYSTLISGTFVQATQGEGFLFIQNLARRGFGFGATAMPPLIDAGMVGPYYDNLLMLAIFGLTTYLTQKMMTTDPNDPMQKQMLTMMPFMVTFMFTLIPLPSGVLLYTLVSNVFTICQNMVLTRRHPIVPVAAVPASEAVIETKAEVETRSDASPPGSAGSGGTSVVKKRN